MELWTNGAGLSLTVVLPLVGAVIIGLLPKAKESLQKVVALLTSLITLALAAGAAIAFNYGSGAEFHLPFLTMILWALAFWRP